MGAADLSGRFEELYPGVYRVFPTNVTPAKYVSFFVKRRGGNLLFPCVAAHGSIAGSFEQMSSMGGVSLQLVGDMHFASKYNDEISGHFDIPAMCSTGEYADVLRKVKRVEAFPFERHELAPKVEAIPTPGHRPGAVSYLVTLAKRRYLFAGDTLYHDKKGWCVFTSKKNRKTMIATLEMLRDIPFDVLLANTSVTNPVCSVELTQAERLGLLAEIQDSIP
jgi:hypothetical protein